MAVEVDSLARSAAARNPSLKDFDASQDSKLYLGSYDPLAFNSLPSITDAGSKLDTINGTTLVPTVFRDLFLRHKMDRTFGLMLLHRHFDLDKGGRLVEYGGTSVPRRLSKLSDSIHGSCWLLSDNSVRPYEYSYTSIREEATEPNLDNSTHQTFFHEFKDLLRKYNVEDVFGLCRYPGDDFAGRVEVTEGRANINLKPADIMSPITFTTSFDVLGLSLTECRSADSSQKT